MPSAIAALVAWSESSPRWRTSLASAFVGAPTLMTAALPDSRAIRSDRKSWSVPMVARSSSARSCDSRRSRASGAPDLVGLAEVRGGHLIEGERRRPRVHLAAGQRCHVLEEVDALLAEARGLD